MKTLFTCRNPQPVSRPVVSAVCALWLAAGLGPGASAAAPPDAIFHADFEEATLGGMFQYVPPSTRTDGTGISATIGVLAPFINDNGVVVAGLAGSGRALQGLDANPGTALRLDAVPSRNPIAGRLQFSLDFKATGPLTGGPLQMLLQKPTGGNYVFAVLVYSDLRMALHNSTGGYGTGWYFTPALALDTEYRLFIDIDLDTYQYKFRVTRLADQAIVAGAGGLNIYNDPALHTDGFGRAILQFGFADFGAPPAGLTIDNYSIVATVAETRRVSGSDGAGVPDDFWVSILETRTAAYVDFLNAAEASQELAAQNGEVRGAATAALYCLTAEAAPTAPVAYNSQATLGQRFTAVLNREDHPVIYVSWFGAAAYCNWRSLQEGRTAVYDAANNWTANLAATGYRLPTEQEWYKAAAYDPALGTFRTFGTGASSISPLSANYFNSGDQFETNAVRTTPVGFFEDLSPYGLRDTSGNVWEWCHDLYDPAGTNAASDFHALRGGSWGNLAAQVKTTTRIDNPPDAVRNTVGFRILTATDPNQ